MNIIQELTGIDWPLGERDKKALRERRHAREKRVLQDRRNRRIYEETRLACEVAETVYDARSRQTEVVHLHPSQSDPARIEKGQGIAPSALYSY